LIFRCRGDVHEVSGNPEQAPAGGGGAGRRGGHFIRHHLVEPAAEGDGVAQGDVDRAVGRQGVGGRKGHGPQSGLVGGRVAGAGQGENSFGGIVAAGDPGVAGPAREGERVAGLHAGGNLHLGAIVGP